MGSVIRSAAWLSAFACFGLVAEVRAQQCRTDADCESGFGCRKDDSATDCDVPPSLPGENQKVPPSCETPAVEEEFGECVPLPIACEADADCPAGLACRKADSETCAASPGGDPAPECMPRAQVEGSCVYVPQTCTSDGDCDAGDACTVTDGERTCSATPGAPCNGGDCEPPPEPQCTSVERRYCFPKRVDCATNADCGADRRCVLLPEEIQEDAPEPWRGATRLCLPEGLALLVEGRIEAAGSVSHESQTTGASRDANGARPEAADTDGSRANDPGFRQTRACAIAAPGVAGAGGAAWLALCGLAFALGIARKRW